MRSRSLCRASGLVAGSAALAVLLGGCSSAHYRRSADQEVYGIIQQVDARVLGKTNEFTLDTPYSGRDPKAILPAEIIGDRAATNRRILNLDQALDLAVRYSREYQTQKEQLYLTALTLTGTRYEFDPQFVAQSVGTITGEGSTAKTGSLNSTLSVSKLLKTGGRLSLALGNDLLRYFTAQFSSVPGQPPVALGNDSAINMITLNLRQPLLRGFGINDPTVESLTQAERNVVYAVRSFSLYQQQFAVDTVSAYFNLVTQKDIVRNNYRSYTNKVETTRYLAGRSVDRVTQSDVDDALSSELGSKISYINSLATYLTLVDSFKTRLGLPLSEQMYVDDQDLKDLVEPGLTPADISREAAFRICVEKQMDILNAIDRFEDSKRKVRIAADQLRAGLTFSGNASVQSQSPDDYVNFDPNKVRYTAQLQLDLPVDRLRERNTYRASLVSFESQLRSLASTLDTYKDRIDRGLRSLEEARLNYLNAVESLKVAERRVENNVLRLEAGRATIRDLREAQDTLIQAQNTLARSYTAYLNVRLSLLLNVGVLDTRPDKFWLLDPLKDQLSPEQRGTPPLRMPDDQVLSPELFIEPAS